MSGYEVEREGRPHLGAALLYFGVRCLFWRECRGKYGKYSEILMILKL